MRPRTQAFSRARSPIRAAATIIMSGWNSLGDRVLALVTAEWLYELFPQEPEGKLSPRLNALVSARPAPRLLGNSASADR
jgi:hypothetical protein